MGIYDELKRSINASAEIVNNYDFSKKNKNEIKDTLSSYFSEVKTAKEKANTAFSDINVLRCKMFSTLLSLANAQYYYSNISNELSKIENMDIALTALTSKSSENATAFSINELLSDLKTELISNTIHNTKIQEYGKTLKNIFTLVKKGFGYEEYDAAGNVKNELSMAFGISNADDVTGDPEETFDNQDEIAFTTLNDNEVFLCNNKKYRLTHRLEYKNPDESNSNITSISKLSIDNMPGLSMDIVFDATEKTNEGIYTRATAKLKISNNIAVESTLYPMDGSQLCPYIIRDINDIKKYSSKTSSAYYIIANDIDLTNETNLKFPYGVYYGDADIKASSNNILDVFKKSDDETDSDILAKISSNIAINSKSGKMDDSYYQNVLKLIDISKGEYTLEFTKDSSTSGSTMYYTTTSSSVFPSEVSAIALEINSDSSVVLKFTISQGTLAYNGSLSKSYNFGNDYLLDSKYGIIYYLADLTKLENYDFEKSADCDQKYLSNIKFMTADTYTTIITLLENTLKRVRTDVAYSENAVYNIINDNVTSYTTIEGLCKVKGPIYSSDYITDIETGFLNISSNIVDGIIKEENNNSTNESDSNSSSNSSLITKLLTNIKFPTSIGIPAAGDIDISISGSSNGSTGGGTTLGRIRTDGASSFSEVSFTDMNKIKSLLSEIEVNILSTLDDIIGIAPRLNNVIDQYIPFFQISNSNIGLTSFSLKLDGTNFLTSASNTYYALNLNKEFSVFYSSTLGTSVSIPFPSFIRKLSDWMANLSIYTNDGIYDLAYLYIGQELGKNILSNNDINSEYLKRCNSIIDIGMRNGLQKALWKKEMFNKSYLAITEYEGTLYTRYRIKLNEDANYEKIISILKTEVPGLSNLEDLDLSDLISGKIEALSDDYNIIIKKIELEFLKSILFAENIATKCSAILSIFNNSEMNFKMLVAKRAFISALKDILTYYFDAGRTDESVYTQLNAMYLSLTPEDELTEDQYLDDDIIFKYQALWSFKYGLSEDIITYIDKTTDLGKKFLDYLIVETSDSQGTESTISDDNNTDSFLKLWLELRDGVKTIYN